MSAQIPNDGEALEPPPDDLAAAEYVLGVTDAAARRRAEQRIATDPAFAEAVVEWERRLALLAADVRPLEVPDRIWQRIRSRVGWGDEPRAVAWQSLGFWRWTAGIAAAIALLAVALDLRPHQGPLTTNLPQETRAVTPLTGDNGAPAWLATVDVGRGTVQMVPVPSAPDAQGRAAELWLIPPGGAPRSLGAVSVSRAYTVVVPQALRADLTTDAVLAVSLEPPGGMPHAAPSGPIIAKGMVRL